MLTINEEFINNIIFDSTLNKIQCEILKISYPLKNNWKDELTNKEISMEDAELLILNIWGLTQNYADFHTQIEMVTGKSLRNKSMYQRMIEHTIHMILYGVIPRDQNPQT